MTRVSKARKDILLKKYLEYDLKQELYLLKENYPMAEIYHHKLKAIRTTLGLLEIHIKGINSI